MHYHKCLVEYGVTGYSWEQCWRDFEFQLFRTPQLAPGELSARRLTQELMALPSVGQVEAFVVNASASAITWTVRF